MALVLESRFTKDQILELYLNDVTLGQRGPFEIHGVAEARRIFFGKDVSNITLAEAATIAGLIQSPSRLSPFRNPDRAQGTPQRGAGRDGGSEVRHEGRRRQGGGRAAEDFGARARERSALLRRLRQPARRRRVRQGCCKSDGGGRRLHDARPAAAAHRAGSARRRHRAGRQAAGRAQEDRARRKRRSSRSIRGPARSSRSSAAAPTTSRSSTAWSPRSGSRAPCSSRSSISRRSSAWRAEGRADLTPATVVVDEPTTFKDGENDYTPANYQNEYDGPITLRRALALSRNIVAIKVAETTGYDRVADLWKRVGVGTPAQARIRRSRSASSRPRRSTWRRPTRSSRTADRCGRSRRSRRVVENGKARAGACPVESRLVARADTTFLVTNMMRSVINEGTGAGARAAGFTLDAAGKSGTTNDLRDAWFIGFTPDLLTAVWVGFDNNQPIGLSGSQAALPIWTTLHEARARRPQGLALQRAGRHRLRRHRQGHRQARAPGLSEGHLRSLSRWARSPRTTATSTAATRSPGSRSLGAALRHIVR